MANFWKAREALLLAHDENIITAEEQFLLNDLNTNKNGFSILKAWFFLNKIF